MDLLVQAAIQKYFLQPVGVFWTISSHTVTDVRRIGAEVMEGKKRIIPVDKTTGSMNKSDEIGEWRSA